MVNMNEDFGAYKDSIWKGLTARELGVMAVSAVSCGIIIILLYFILGWNLYISFLIGTAVAAAIIFSQVSHSEEQAALFLDAAGTEEWTLEDLRTLAAQSDIDSMKILQRKIEQLHKASQKKNNK